MKLDCGGESWKGWRFNSWGRARDWYLFDPQGTRYSAGEIVEGVIAIRDVDILTRHVRELQEKAKPDAVSFSDDDIKSLHIAVAILLRALPSLRWLGVHRGLRIRAA